jgi:hypothetical protein
MISGKDLCEYIYIDEEDRRLSENNILNTGRNGVGLLGFTQFSTIFQLYYEFSLLHIFSLVIQPWMSAYIRKTDGVYMYVFGLPHLGTKKQWQRGWQKQKYLRFTESIS